MSCRPPLRLHFALTSCRLHLVQTPLKLHFAPSPWRLHVVQTPPRAAVTLTSLTLHSM